MRSFRLLLFALAAIPLAAIFSRSPLAGWVALFIVSALLTPLPTSGFCYTPTLTTAEIVSDVFEAFRKMVVALRFLATDFSSVRAKYNQQIIAHVAALPTVVAHDTVNGFFNSPQSAKDLLTDVPLTMDTWKDVILTLKANDLVADRTPKYVKTINGAAYQLGKAMLDSVLGKVNSTNISNQLVCADANATAAKLRLFATQLNSQGAGPMRNGLVSSGFMTGLLADNVIASGDYYDQRQESGPFAILNNIAGFQSVMEYPDFPANTGSLGTFTAVAATNVITVSAAHGLVVGDRVRFSSDDTLPAGLSVDTDYFVITVPSTTTLTVSATSGGAAVDITDTGTGTHTISRYDNLTGFFFEDRAVVVASRLPADSLELAQQRGIPVPMKVETVTDPETGLTVLMLERFNTATLDIEICFSVMFGSAVGRQAGTAATLLDNAGLRIVKA